MNQESLKLHPIDYIGLSKLTRFDLTFLDDDKEEDVLIYPVMSSLVYYDLSRDQMSYYSFASDRNEVIDRYFPTICQDHVVCETELLNGRKTVYIIDTRQKCSIKSLKDPIFDDDLLIDLSLSHDGIKLARLTKSRSGLSVSKILIWSLIRSELIVDFDLTIREPLRVEFHPTESSKILVVSKTSLISFSIDHQNRFDKDWVESSFESGLSSFSWANHSQILIGDKKGQIILFDINERKTIVKIDTKIEINQMERQIELKTVNIESAEIESRLGRHKEDEKDEEDETGFVESNSTRDQSVRQIIPLSNGFAFVSGTNRIVVYSKSLLQNEFKLRHVSQLPHKGTQTEEDEINKMAVNKSERLLVCMTKQNRLYKLSLNSLTTTKKMVNLESIRTFHSSPIRSIDTCKLKPLVLTADDHSIRLWDYEERRLVLTKSFNDEIYTAALHPFGLHLAVGFSNKLSFYSVIGNDLSLVKSFSIYECKSAKFSANCGGYLGVIEEAKANLIRAYDVWNDDEEKYMIEISISVGRFEHFEWAHNDSYIVACTSAGLVAVWSRFSGSRLCEYVDKRAHFRTLTGRKTDTTKRDEIHVLVLDKHGNMHSLFAKCDSASGNLIRCDIDSSSEAAVNNSCCTSSNRKEENGKQRSSSSIKPTTPVADLELDRVIAYLSFASVNNERNDNVISQMNLVSRKSQKINNQATKPTSIVLIGAKPNCCLLGNDKGQVGIFNYRQDIEDEEEFEKNEEKLLSFKAIIRLARESICQLAIRVTTQRFSSSNKVYVISGSRNGLITIACFYYNHPKSHKHNEDELLLIRPSLTDNSSIHSSLNRNLQQELVENQIELLEEEKFEKFEWPNLSLETRERTESVRKELANLKKRKENEKQEKSYEIELESLVGERRVREAKNEAKATLVRVKSWLSNAQLIVDSASSNHDQILDDLERKLLNELESIKERRDELLLSEYEKAEKLKTKLNELEKKAAKETNELKLAIDRENDFEEGIARLKLNDFKSSAGLEINARLRVIDEEKSNCNRAFSGFEMTIREELVMKNRDRVVSISNENESIRVQTNLIRKKLLRMRTYLRYIKENESKLNDLVKTQKQYSEKLVEIEWLKRRGEDESIVDMISRRFKTRKGLERQLERSRGDNRMLLFESESLEKRLRLEEAFVGRMRNELVEKEKLLLDVEEERNRWMKTIKTRRKKREQ